MYDGDTCCTSYYEGTELKANHNAGLIALGVYFVVLAITKVLNWKLITTIDDIHIDGDSCTSYYEGTELKANHNSIFLYVLVSSVVLAITKVLNWKLITTTVSTKAIRAGCTSYYEGTELKANHNKVVTDEIVALVVLAITKVLNWKLITTTRVDLSCETSLY